MAQSGANEIEIGDTVEWEWGSGTASGTVTKRYTERIEKTIEGNEVVRNASSDSPAFLIEQEDGDEVLKSASEVTKK